MQDILFAFTDNPKGFPEATEAIFPKTEVQGCIVHHVRYTLRYVSYKDIKAVIANKKAIYKAPYEAAAQIALEAFAQKWEQRYSKVVESWRNNWPRLSTYLRYLHRYLLLLLTGFFHALYGASLLIDDMAHSCNGSDPRTRVGHIFHSAVSEGRKPLLLLNKDQPSCWSNRLRS